MKRQTQSVKSFCVLLCYIDYFFRTSAMASFAEKEKLLACGMETNSVAMDKRAKRKLKSSSVFLFLLSGLIRLSTFIFIFIDFSFSQNVQIFRIRLRIHWTNPFHFTCSVNCLSKDTQCFNWNHSINSARRKQF